jgi:hypothetical protein
MVSAKTSRTPVMPVPPITKVFYVTVDQFMDYLGSLMDLDLADQITIFVDNGHGLIEVNYDDYVGSDEGYLVLSEPDQSMSIPISAHYSFFELEGITDDQLNAMIE